MSILITALAGHGSMLFERKMIQTVEIISKRRPSVTLHFCFPANFDCLTAADLSPSAGCWRFLHFGAVTGNPGTRFDSNVLAPCTFLMSSVWLATATVNTVCASGCHRASRLSPCSPAAITSCMEGEVVVVWGEGDSHLARV
jgi:hypothetical protein